MKKALVYAETDESARRMAQALRDRGGFEALCTAEIASVRRDCDAFDAVIAIAPSLSLSLEETLKTAAMRSCAGIVLVVGREGAAQAENALRGLGVAVVSLPLNAPLFFQSLHTAALMSERLRAIKRENERLRCTIDDLKLVDRAKCALIQYLNMTEADAHRFIEKQAMNKRVSKRDAALEILKTYE